jgi:hypothetical protein
MAVSATNRKRYRAMLIARSVRWIFMAIPERSRGLIWRWLFLSDDDTVHAAGEMLLADLRAYCFLDRAGIFDPDPIVMAYREGRRSVGMRVFNYLNMDEKAVQQLMEIDDGLE